MTLLATDHDAIRGPAGPERLAALRSELSHRNLDGFIIPRADEHQGEYVAPSAQRLAWLTGFTGSAGAAVVTMEQAAIFVDGRYTLQVETEVDTARFQVRHLIDHPPSRWVAETLKEGQRLGFDPWLHTGDQAEALRLACERRGARLEACDTNPVDAVWTDRPAAPRRLVHVHPASLAGRSSADKRKALAAQLSGEGIGAAVLTLPESVAWLLNVRGADVAYTPLPLSFAILHADATMDWFIDPAKVPPAVAAHLGNAVRLSPHETLERALDALGKAGLRVRVDGATAPVAVTSRLLTAGARLDQGPDPCLLPKACKNAAELAGARAAHRRDGAAMARFLAWLGREAPMGMVDELSAAVRLESFRAEGERFRGLSFPTISGSGPNGAIVHYRSGPETNRRLEPGMPYLVDSGAQYLDGTTDVTRTVALGKTTARQRRHYTLVLKGHLALSRAVFPTGTSGSQLDVLARAPLWAEGLDYDHGTGHGVGSFLSVHEGPQRISKLGNTVALRPGMVLSIEPGYYQPGAYGIRIENLVVVCRAKAPRGAEKPLLRFEPLTLVPFDRRLMDLGLLTLDEREWIDRYHARVLAEVAPLVKGTVRHWLERACRPL